MKLKYYIIGAAIAFTGLTSCHKDNLTAAPPTSISDATAFDQPYRIANQVLSLYAQLKEGRVYGGRVLVYGDIRGEDFLLEDPNLVTNADVWNQNPTSTATAIVGLWAQAYTTINNCNVFIDGMNAKGIAVVGSTLGNNYIGEARLIRALCYYQLLQYYARPFADGAGSKLGLPLRLTGIKGAGSSDLARSSVKDVYTQILLDLNFAENNLPLTYGVGNVNNVIRAHKNTAIALKTRVYLSMQDYPNVSLEAAKIVTGITAPFYATNGGVKDSLASDLALIVFKTPYVSGESIFSLPFTVTSPDIPGTQNGLQGYYFSGTNAGSSIFSLNPAGIIANAGWTATDRRRSFIFTAPSGKKYLSKFPTASPADNTPVIRYSEVLLNYAEAIVRVSNTVDPKAVALLNAVRQRSDPTTVFTVAGFANAAALIDAILTERRIEFLGEGLRTGDILRLLQTFPAKGTAPAKAPSEDGYIWPVSATEKALNKLWVDG